MHADSGCPVLSPHLLQAPPTAPTPTPKPAAGEAGEEGLAAVPPAEEAPPTPARPTEAAPAEKLAPAEKPAAPKIAAEAPPLPLVTPAPTKEGAAVEVGRHGAATAGLRVLLLLRRHSLQAAAAAIAGAAPLRRFNVGGS